jgi:hypothetical protein
MSAADAELSALLTLAIAAPFLAQAEPQLEPHAQAIAASFAFFILRHLRPDDARLAVFLTAAWPSIGTWLALRALAESRKSDGPGTKVPSPFREACTRFRRSSHADGGGDSLFRQRSRSGPRPSYDAQLHAGELPLLDPKRATARCRPSTVAGLLFLAYAVALAYRGSSLAFCWPWPLSLPQLAGALVALACWLRRPGESSPSWVRSWAEASATVLPASTMADFATVWVGAPDDVRAVVGAVTWGLLGSMLVVAQSTTRAR